MSVTPTGSPAWVRTADHTNYGGNTEKRNYQSQGVVNPETDVGAEDFARLAADVAAVARTSPFCVITFLQDDSTPDDPTVEYVNMMTGIRTTSYDGGTPPSGFPTVTRNGDGDVSITFESNYSDDYAVSGAFTPKHASGNAHGSTAATVSCSVSGSVVTALTFDAAGAAETDKRVTVEVY